MRLVTTTTVEKLLSRIWPSQTKKIWQNISRPGWLVEIWSLSLVSLWAATKQATLVQSLWGRQSVKTIKEKSLITRPQMSFKEKINILWFRNGLRLHDNESLKLSTEDRTCKFLPLFIFDGETPTTKYCKYNKISFLLECLEDLEVDWAKWGKISLWTLQSPYIPGTWICCQTSTLLFPSLSQTKILTGSGWQTWRWTWSHH